MLAIIPGTSRSGATIIGGMLCGCSRTAAAEFTFFLAIPIMFGWGLVKCIKFAAAGLAMTTTEAVVLAVLDIGLPGLDGLNLTRRLREIGWKKPIIMLTARDTVPDRVRGLESGADDYLVKPFALAELHARIRAQLRRSEVDAAPSVLTVGDLTLNLRMWTVERAGQSVKLNATAMKILALLMKKSPTVVTKEELAREVWGTPPSAETIRSHLYMLRNAVDKPFEKPLIKTITGVGWTLRSE